MIKYLLWFLALVAVAMGATYWWAGKDEVALTDEARADAPGQFLNIPQGRLHYRIRGPVDGPVILTVHGFSTPNFIFEQNAEALAAAGFRVIQFDHFGRGWSDRPQARYDADFYDRTLIELLDGLAIDEPVGMIGLSMGGIISTEFAARHPERVRALALFVPAGLAVAGSDDFSLRIARMPVIGDWLWRVSARSLLLGDRQYDESGLAEANRLQGDVTEQMRFAGYFPALHATMRHLDMVERDARFAAVGEAGIPVLAMFGEADPTIPVEAADRLRTANPAADVRLLPDADHGLNYKQHETVNPWLVDFFAPMLAEGDDEADAEADEQAATE